MNITYLDWIVFFVGFLIALYIYGIRIYNYYEDKGVKYVKPAVPFMGSTIGIFFQYEHLSDFVTKYYNMFKDQKYVGLFEMTKPLILIRDLDLLKQICIKNFDSFPNHRIFLTDEMDSLLGNSLFALQNEKWRDMRATLSPAFTSSKMKNMFILVEECAKDFTDYFVEEAEKCGNGMVEIETKDAFTKYTNDVIATSAFGLKMNSLKEKNNEFYNTGKDLTNFSGMRMFKFLLHAIIPKTCRALDIQVFSKKTTSFFRDIVESTIAHRQSSQTVRHDMIDILIAAKKGSLKHERHVDEAVENEFATVEESAIGKRHVTRKWTDDELTAQALIFLVGGFETASTLIVFFLYELVRNPDVQKKLHEEIDEFLAKSDGKVTYDDVKQLKYLDMTISETLRMWPPAMAIDRVCSKDYTLPPPTDDSNQTFTIKSGELVWIPIYAIHHDPQYFPNPKKFDPERFSDENKSSINPTSYMPFGTGPRNCIGSRYALLVGKIIAFHILSKFDIVTTDKTEIPIKLSKKTFNLWAEKGLHVGLKLRK